MKAVRNLFGGQDTSKPRSKPSSTKPSSQSSSKPTATSALPRRGVGRPKPSSSSQPKSTPLVFGSSSPSKKTKPTARNGTVTPNKNAKAEPPSGRKSTTKPATGTTTKRTSSASNGRMTPRRPSIGKSAPTPKPRRNSTPKVPASPERSSASPVRPRSPKRAATQYQNNGATPVSPKRNATTGIKKGYLSKGPAFSEDRTTEDLYKLVPASKWIFSRHKFTGSFQYDSIGEQESVNGKFIQKAVEYFKKNPAKYVAIMYQTDMENWPPAQQSYILVHREGTVRFQPRGVSENAWMTIMIHKYQHLPAFKDNILPSKYQDKYTDDMVHLKRKIHNQKNPPIMPGRGMGVGDTPLLKLIGDVDPSDIHQGQVGDCWLLSAISALAEFDGAVKKLFRKTKNLETVPLETPNTYVVTLWDIETWKEVDIVIDERLPSASDGSGQLLGAKPSEDGELWVCYLEKAVAIHCGGWDKITGGQCSHAWSILTGCREQYTIRKNPKNGNFGCFAKYNPQLARWAPQKNCPQDNVSNLWPVPFPRVGSSTGSELELPEKEVFKKMYAFDLANYIVGAGTKGTSDKNLSDGMVDNHAYSVIEAVENAAGTGIDLFKVRNPWGKGEIENGEFDDDGPGWKSYPEIKKLLNPVVADDGIFWLRREEFFKIFDHIYVSASNMTTFLED